MFDVSIVSLLTLLAAALAAVSSIRTWWLITRPPKTATGEAKVTADPSISGYLQTRDRREARLRALAATAVNYASAQKSSGNADKLRHALEAFRLLDDSDGQRDFTEAQARVAIEAALVGVKQARAAQLPPEASPGAAEAVRSAVRGLGQAITDKK